ncbi:MAG: CotH kinase family protein [Muribaculaceae bacterium]|nr:CotH kinase family protein [Muribaculaceae bacterium]
MRKLLLGSVILALILLAVGLMVFYTPLPSYEQMKRGLDEKSLPIVNLVVDTTQIGRTTFIDAGVEITYFDADSQRCVSASYQCQLRYRGNYAYYLKKRSFAMKLVNDEGKKLNASLLGMREENSWILDAMAVDRLRMRNRVCFDIWNELSRTPYDTKYDRRNGTQGQFVEVFINGEYHGLYCLSDKIDRKLLGLKKTQIDERGDTLVRGILYKGDRWGGALYLKDYDSTIPCDTVQWNNWELSFPDKRPSAKTWRPLADLIDFCSSSTSPEAFLAQYQEWFFDENLVDYFVFLHALKIRDICYKNTFLSTPDLTKGHRYLLTPWDMDHSFGGYWDGGYDTFDIDVNRFNDRHPFNRLYGQNVNHFADRCRDRWAEVQHTLFEPQAIEARLNAYAQRLEESGAWHREFRKWNKEPVPLHWHIKDELNIVMSSYRQNYDLLCQQFGTAR